MLKSGRGPCIENIVLMPSVPPSLRLFLRLRAEDAVLDLELLLVEGESAAVAEAEGGAVRHPRRAVGRGHALACKSLTVPWLVFGITEAVKSAVAQGRDSIQSQKLS